MGSGLDQGTAGPNQSFSLAPAAAPPAPGRRGGSVQHANLPGLDRVVGHYAPDVLADVAKPRRGRKDQQRSERRRIFEVVDRYKAAAEELTDMEREDRERRALHHTDLNPRNLAVWLASIDLGMKRDKIHRALARYESERKQGERMTLLLEHREKARRNLLPEAAVPSIGR